MSTSIGQDRQDRIWTFALLGAGGAAIAGAAPWLARWTAQLPIVPFGDVLEWVGAFDDPWWHVVRPLVGLVVGLVAAAFVVADEYTLEIDDDHVAISHGNDRRTVARDAIVAVHRDGKLVTIDGHQGRVIFAHDVDASRDEVREAFTSHDYPYESS